MISNSVAALAMKAADLLPEAPAVHDSFGYLAWEELVLTTARRLWAHSGGEVGYASPNSGSTEVRTGRLTASDLLALAAVTADPTSSEDELALNKVLARRSDLAHTRYSTLERGGTVNCRRLARTLAGGRGPAMAAHFRG